MDCAKAYSSVAEMLAGLRASQCSFARALPHETIEASCSSDQSVRQKSVKFLWPGVQRSVVPSRSTERTFDR